MRRSDITVGITAAVILIAASTCVPARQAPVDDEIIIAGVDARFDVHVREIETGRLVCAIATRVGAVAISCVPNIPGMFEEPGQ